MTKQEKSRREKARIASKAQARAHRALREAHPDEYRDEYQRAKDELTEAEGRERRET